MSKKRNKKDGKKPMKKGIVARVYNMYPLGEIQKRNKKNKIRRIRYKIDDAMLGRLWLLAKGDSQSADRIPDGFKSRVLRPYIKEIHDEFHLIEINFSAPIAVRLEIERLAKAAEKLSDQIVNAAPDVRDTITKYRAPLPHEPGSEAEAEGLYDKRAIPEAAKCLATWLRALTKRLSEYSSQPGRPSDERDTDIAVALLRTWEDFSGREATHYRGRFVADGNAETRAFVNDCSEFVRVVMQRFDACLSTSHVNTLLRRAIKQIRKNRTGGADADADSDRDE